MFFFSQDLRRLTTIALGLSKFKLLCETTEVEMFGAREPLSVFFASCGRLYDFTQVEATKKEIADNLQAALMGFEKWIPMSDSPPVLFKIHIVIALVIFNCSQIVYVRVNFDGENKTKIQASNERFFSHIFSQSRHVSFL